MTALLELREVSRHFAPHARWGRTGAASLVKAVDGVSLKVEAGKTLALVGESGCGKSTTARLALGLMPLSGGEVRFQGTALSARRDGHWRQLRQKMQMVYQDPLSSLDRRQSVLQQIIEPMEIFSTGTPAWRRDRARDLMNAVGLSGSLAQRFPHELSGGQRQRAVIARALALEPALLVCDEPVSALDVSIQAQIINLLQDIQRQTGVGMLFISHDLKMVRQVSHEVAVMYLGKVIEQAAPATLFKAPLHPYTQALISAIPSIEFPRRRTRMILSGDPPNPAQRPSGCAFHPRCPSAMATCKTVTPALRQVHSGHQLACHLPVPVHTHPSPPLEVMA